MEQFAQLIALAALVGLLTDRYKKTVSNTASMIVSILTGIILAVVYQQGILQAVGLVPAVPGGQYVDYVLTGIVIAAGPNAIYDYIKRRDPGGKAVINVTKIGGSE